MSSSSTRVVDPHLRLLTEAHELLLKANEVYFDRGNQNASEIFHIIRKLTSIKYLETENSKTAVVTIIDTKFTMIPFLI